MTATSFLKQDLTMTAKHESNDPVGHANVTMINIKRKIPRSTTIAG